MIRSLVIVTLGVFIAGTAIAQQAQTTTGGVDSGALQEVVVTARRYAEDLKSTPIAVTALSAATIQVQDVTNLEDLSSFVPNFKISADRATSSTINVIFEGWGRATRCGDSSPPSACTSTMCIWRGRRRRCSM